MDVPALGAGPTGTELTSAIGGLAAPKARALASLAALQGVAQAGDTINATLSQLSEPAVLLLLEIIERAPAPEIAVRVEGLLRAAVAAAAEGKAPQALAGLAELAALDPRRAETLESEHGLASIRPEVRKLLSQLASAAHLSAESRLARATQLVESMGPRELRAEELNPQVAIMLAGRLLEAGGYASCMRSAELSQMAINEYAFVLTPAPLALLAEKQSAVRSMQATAGARREWMPWIGELWRRGPLLVLLLAWLAIGLVCGSISAIWRSNWPQTWPKSQADLGFDVWGTGFLALIGLGFYARVRKQRR